MRRTRSIALACAGLGTMLIGCGASTAWTRRGTRTPPRDPGCQFDVLSTSSAHKYQVIGVIDIAAFSVRALPNSDDKLRAVLADKVCLEGGDAVVPAINGDGRYVLATVVQYIDLGVVMQGGLL